MSDIEISDELQATLKSIIDQFDKEEFSVREFQIRLWKQLELYWAGYQNIWWSDTAHDWRIFGDVYNSGDTNDSGFYDKRINVFRAFLESIIAAMSSNVPFISALPDDADNPADVSTARGANKIGELVYRHIDAPLLWCKALFVYCLQGMVAAYNYTDTDEKYGTVPTAKYKNVEQDVTTKVCPECNQEMISPDNLFASGDINSDNNQDEPNDNQDENEPNENQQQEICLNCNQQVTPQINTSTIKVQQLDGITNEPKSRQCIEVLGGLFVKVPNWARCQADTPYLCYEYETHTANVLAKYPNLRKDGNVNFSTDNGNQAYERWGRLSPQYRSEFPIQTPTVRNWWLRPSAYELISDDDLRADIKKKFPDGCKIVYVNDTFAEICDEKLDEHWTLTYNPLSEYLHFDPLGMLLTSIQDITSDLVSLTLQTIEHGIPQTFADPSTLDFDVYRNSEAIPGGVYPARPRTNKSIQDGFYTVSTSQLSREVGPFSEQVQEFGQFVSGAMPSLFGGPQAGSSRTASQYAMSRNQALQRLQTPWKMINVWWKNTFGKVIPAYIENMLEDEHFVQKIHDNYINVSIERAKLDGKLGSIELESSEDIPLTSGQIHDAIMNLMQMNNPAILQMLGSPENIESLKSALQLPGFELPGECDREKQYEEIQILIKTAPIPTGQGEIASVMPEMEVDNHAIHAEICKNYLVSEHGRILKVENQDGYKNILLHLKYHLMLMQQNMPPPQQQMPNQQQQVPPQQGNNNGQ